MITLSEIRIIITSIMFHNLPGHGEKFSVLIYSHQMQSNKKAQEIKQNFYHLITDREISDPPTNSYQEDS